jgi:hypothetical protein
MIALVESSDKFTRIRDKIGRISSGSSHHENPEYGEFPINEKGVVPMDQERAKKSDEEIALPWPG